MAVWGRGRDTPVFTIWKRLVSQLLFSAQSTNMEEVVVDMQTERKKHNSLKRPQTTVTREERGGNMAARRSHGSLFTTYRVS